MKKLVLLFLSITTFSSVFAQKDNVGIGTTKPDQSAVLDLNSQTKGFLTPRMTLQQRSAIQSPAKGLLIYQTDMVAGFYFYNGDEWKTLGADAKSNSIAGVDGDWTLLGNTAPAGSFIGTKNSEPFRIVSGNYLSGYIDNVNFNYFAGYKSAGSAVGVYDKRAAITGTANTGVGALTLFSLTTGSSNMAIGSTTLYDNTTGSDNVGIGRSSLRKNTTGNNNLAIGTYSLYNNLTGANNLAIGWGAGENSTGSNNILLGYQAGRSELGSDKLYIANSSTANPLIKGEFDNKNLKINLGATKSSTVGFLAVGNFDSSFPMPGALTSTANSYRLIVQDGIITEKIKVAVKGTNDWADYVFEPSYQLMSLDKVESFVKENKHLPNVPSAEDMSKNGLDVSQTSAKLMEKIEELTLYIIEMNKEIKSLKAENVNFRKAIEQK
ncbi:hypothetical protein [Emticicia sp. BO119]|uniref:hypothetical protein n=1 Tax=Emticicia sp. BO119 TaxID=2757768 RepID=UPI0015F02B1E|nr:hypothetical protein [Emticicia sp. BO119]MBA4853950.1 hypothetical protein [Emticicia sp. BO119]